MFVELPKFTKSLEDLESLSDKWLYFLKYANQLQSVPPTMEQEPAINHAFQVAKHSRLSRKELELLEQREMALHDNRNAILLAERKGRQEGRQAERLKIARGRIQQLGDTSGRIE